MNLESLEPRRLFDVTVTEGYPGFFEIHGDGGDDAINVAINMAEESLTVNGQTYQSVVYVVAYGEGGDDWISITSVDGVGSIGGAVDAGVGNDRILLAVDGGVWAGPGNDEIYLLDSFRGEAYGEAGNDYLHIAGLTTDAEIQGGAGADFIDCSENQYGVVVGGGSGDDTIYGSELADQLYGEEGNDYVNGMGGNDMIYVPGGGEDVVNGGDGDDIASIDANGDFADGFEQVYYV
jgi:Ca2+-binding RTX toxin-like protein